MARLVISRDVKDAERAPVTAYTGTGAGTVPPKNFGGERGIRTRAQARHAGPRQAFPRNTRLDKRYHCKKIERKSQQRQLYFAAFFDEAGNVFEFIHDDIGHLEVFFGKAGSDSDAKHLRGFGGPDTKRSIFNDQTLGRL